MSYNANVHNSIGAILYAYAGTPASDDESGFTSVTGWVQVGELTDFGAPGVTVDQDEFAPQETGVTEYRNGFKSFDTADYECGRDVTDAGQTLIRDAVANGTQISLKISDTSGDEYYRGNISGLTPTDRSDGVVMFGFTFQPCCEQVLVTA